MSKVLMIRHLPSSLSLQDKERLLKHFGAEKVWETRSRRNYLFASFTNVDKAKAALRRLHQLEIAQRRLVVEYSYDKEPVTSKQPGEEQNSEATKLIKEFLKTLNAWNPTVDFYQPPPVHLGYKYPDITTEIIVNVIHALFSHKAFYIQTLHLMNKMCLEDPFRDNGVALIFFKEQFKKFFVESHLQMTQQSNVTESEISSAEDDQKILNQKEKVIKRKRKRAVPKFRPTGMLSVPPPSKSKKIISQEEAFEMVTPIIEPKKILVTVHQDALQKPSEDQEIVGELGKFQKEVQPVQVEGKQEEPEQPTITKKELLRNRISYSDMKILPVFKNYHPGEPSMRLYIKNLVKTVTEQDVKRIYKRYVENVADEDMTGFDVRVMQEGRMKGQAFVTFPSVTIAETALNETNGYLLKERPMVVQFARAANKKTID